MTHVLPILACGSMGLTETQWNLLITAFTLWLASFVLLIVNFCLVARLRRRFAPHMGLLFTYVGLAIALYCGWLPGPPYTLTPPSWAVVLFYLYTIPSLVIAHFVVLLLVRRREKTRYGS